MDGKHLALEAIRKKLVGKKLSYKEIYAVMDEIAHEKLGDVLTTYFAAAGYSKGFSNEEIYHLTRAMVETGERLTFKGIVADKHSIGGNPGGRSTLILVPLIAAAGFTIPKSSSRAITTPSGTADAMEVLSNVTFSKEKIYEIVERTNGCIVWGGSFKIAPADDEIIRIEEPLMFESFDKILVSVMAKKIAFGATHLVIDLPYGKTAKVHGIEDAEVLRDKFEYLAHKFKIKIKVLLYKIEQSPSRGIGPLLEAREALRVLEQHPERAEGLEQRALKLADSLLALCLEDAAEHLKQEVLSTYRTTAQWAREILVSGKALTKMREIIKEQGGNPHIESSHLRPGSHEHEVLSKNKGIINSLNYKNLTLIAKVLGAPKDKKAGIYLLRQIGDKVGRRDPLCILYSDEPYALREAIDSLDLFPLFDIV